MKARRTASLILLAGILQALSGLSPAVAGEDRFSAAAPVSDASLSSLRGGFLDGRGMFASFGIERTTSLNGQVVFRQSVQIADLSRATAADMASLRSVVGGALVLQNSRNDQTIRNSVTIDATSNSLGILQRSGAARAVADALIAPLVRP